MICNKFTVWLDEGNTSNSIAGLPAEFAHHVSGCSQCQKSLTQQIAVMKRLTDSTVLTGDARQRILSKLEKQIEASQPAPTSFFESLIKNLFMPSSRKLLYAGVFLAMVAMPIMFFSRPDSQEYKISAVSSKIQQLVVGDHLNCSTEKTKISWNSQDQIEIDGQAEFIVGKNRLKMLNGTARLAFSKSARGYEIEMQECTLTIVGTVVKLEMIAKKDHIFVERGKVKWQHLRFTDNGLLSSGQSISISAEKNETDKSAHERPANAEPVVENTTAEPVLPQLD